MIRLPEIKTAELSTYGNFAKCHQALFRVPREGLGTRLLNHRQYSYYLWLHANIIGVLGQINWGGGGGGHRYKTRNRIGNRAVFTN